MKLFIVRGMIISSCLLLAVSGIENDSSTSPTDVTVEPISTKETTTTVTPATTKATTTTITPATTKATTTTVVPTTATNPTTTTNAPVPLVPDPESKKYIVNGTDQMIILNMALQIDVTYVDSNKNETVKINVPHDNSSTAFAVEFAPHQETMNVTWSYGTGGNDTIIFKFDCDNHTYTLQSLIVSLQPAHFPGLKSDDVITFNHNSKLFNTTLGNSYRCARLQTLNLTSLNPKVFGKLLVHNLQLQAFKNDNKPNFGFANDCSMETPDIVPIAVGCVLAGLVVIVLAAYLITRRRSQARGYLSM